MVTNFHNRLWTPEAIFSSDVEDSLPLFFKMILKYNIFQEK